MINMILISPPSAGKGTQSKMLSEKFKIPHISTGSILREEINKKTELGTKIKDTIERGILLDDKTIFEILHSRLMKEDCKNGYVLDGFPRTLKQAKLYDEFLKETKENIKYVFYLSIDKNIAYERLKGRLICSNCQATYNELIEEVKPIVNDVCNECGSNLIKRVDDNYEVFIKRFELFLTEIEPLKNYYKEKGILYEIEGSEKVMDTFSKIVQIINCGDLSD